MKYIKHSKFKNTGLIFELLVRQIAADTIARKDSPAVQILKKYYSEKSALGKEYKLYEFVGKHKNLPFNKANTILNTILETSKKLNQSQLKTQKYQLIKELKESYNLEDFFSIKVQEYKTYAALYCILEIENTADLIDPQSIVENKTTILEHLTNKEQNPDTVKDTLIEEYSKYDRDLKLLAYRILLEKFNTRYKELLPEQKNILKEFIVSVNSSKKLNTLVNEELVKIKASINSLKNRVVDDITKIKLEEVHKAITPLKQGEKVSDQHLINLMQYYDLVSELRGL
jgi:uncharacterized protein YajQ (UPF0234 family)